MTSTTSVPPSGFLPDVPSIPTIPKPIHSALVIQKPETKPMIIIFNESSFYLSPKRATKRKERSDNNDYIDEAGERMLKKPNYGSDGLKGVVFDEDNDEENDSGTRRTRCELQQLFVLQKSKHYHRPNVSPGLTPWGDSGMFADKTYLYPEGRELNWNNCDVPDFDLGEPLDELNFWEEPRINANEEKMKVRDEREEKRKRQQGYRGLKTVGRKIAYKKHAEAKSKREKLEFEELEGLSGKHSIHVRPNFLS
jgi:hypothetical protein